MQLFCVKVIYVLYMCSGLKGRIIQRRDEESLTGTNDVDDQVRVLARKLDQLQQRLTDLENKPQSFVQRAYYPDVIGFSVQLDSDVNDLPLGSTVIFDGVWYNAGNGYDTTTGVFTCPKSGVYLFEVHVEGIDTNEAEVTIVVDGSKKVAAIAERCVEGHDSTGSSLLVTHIQKGQRVWIETFYYDNQRLFRHFTGFSGVLIHSTE